ncbi:MAG TPA: LysM peptidoglycan-binding domain-containing protein [Verrucomicrobiae bacterium]|nr:LysM peptidoglycan-binding domain-containing protein [Verrucomicrobiae bacterium]
MKHKELLIFATAIVLGIASAQIAPAQDQTIGQQVGILDERLSKLRADVDALQASQQQIQQDIKQLQSQIADLHQSGPSASANDLEALEARVKALDAAREADKKAIIDQLAKELASMSGSHGSGGSTSNSTATPANGNEYTVQKGDTLTSIAKNNGVTVAELRKANSLTSDSLKVGQKLVLPAK